MSDLDAEIKYILDESLARAAIRVALPTIRAFVPAAAWGPRGAVLVIDPGLEEPVVHEMEEVSAAGQDLARFEEVARAKLAALQRTGRTSGALLIADPAGLRADDTLFEGSAGSGSLMAAASGLKGFGDTAAAEVLLRCAQLLSRAVVERLREGEGTFVGDGLAEARSAVLAELAL